MFRASNVQDINGNGSGLGLYITKSIVDYVHGKIWFTSEQNKGSTFFVSLPISGMKAKEGKTTLD
jgi:two-component system sensor histidine kinase VicK